MKIQEIRQKYPQYSDMSDDALASALHAKYYADMPKDQFAQKIGLAPAGPNPNLAQNSNEAANRPEASVFGMKVSGETDSGFSPAAAIISAGRLGQNLKDGSAAGMAAIKLAIDRLNPLGDGGAGAMDTLDAIKKSREQQDPEFAKLEAVHPGSSQIGQIAPLLPLGPGALATAAGMEYGSPQERALKVGGTLLGNKLAKVTGNALGGRVDDLAAAKNTNALRDKAIAELKDQGYKALPSESGGNLTGRIMEGASGQIKTKQAFQVANQPVSNRIALSEAGAAEGADLTYKTLKEARAAAYNDGYKPLMDLWGDKVRLKPSETFKFEVSSISSRADKASNAFGDSVKSDVSALVENVKKAKPFTVDEALSSVSIWREKASDAYRTGDRDMGKAYRKLAESLEDELARHLAKSKNGALLTKYQQARKTIAKNFDIEASLVEGQGVNVSKLAAKYAKNPDRYSDGTLVLAKAGSYLKDSTKLPTQGGQLPVSALDTWGLGVGGPIGAAASVMSGNPIPAMLPLMAVGGRVGSRKALMSGPGQRAFTNPNYDPGMLLRGERALLDNPYAAQFGGLLGYEASR